MAKIFIFFLFVAMIVFGWSKSYDEEVVMQPSSQSNFNKSISWKNLLTPENEYKHYNRIQVCSNIVAKYFDHLTKLLEIHGIENSYLKLRPIFSLPPLSPNIDMDLISYIKNSLNIYTDLLKNGFHEDLKVNTQKYVNKDIVIGFQRSILSLFSKYIYSHLGDDKIDILKNVINVLNIWMKQKFDNEDKLSLRRSLDVIFNFLINSIDQVIGDTRYFIEILQNLWKNRGQYGQQFGLCMINLMKEIHQDNSALPSTFQENLRLRKITI